MVISPEHPYIDTYKGLIKNIAEVEAYRKEAAAKSDFERSELAKDIVRTWLTTDFEGGRHARRVDLIDRLDRGEDID